MFCVLVRVASAQTPTPTPEAERLFQEGLALFDAGKVEEACGKFEQSIKKNPRALGTLMNLGRCAERRGKVATALALYQEAFDRASEAGASVATEKAQERITALAAQVPVVVIKRAGAALPSEKLVVDDKVVPSDKTELPLDPGTHTFVLTAPGRLPFETSLNVKVAEKVTLQLPVLELPKVRTVVTRVGSTRRTLGKLLAIGGGGVVLTSGALVLYPDRCSDRSCRRSHRRRDRPHSGRHKWSTRRRSRRKTRRSRPDLGSVLMDSCRARRGCRRSRCPASSDRARTATCRPS